MTTSKLFRSPVVHRSGAILAAAFLLAAGTRQAGAAPSAAGSSGSSEGSTATATASRSASTTTSNEATTGGATSSPSASACPDQVQITFGRMTVSGGMVTISFSHNAHNCPSAQPARLHLHQNLLVAPQAGSDPVHQWNADLDIGPSHADGITVPLLKSADGKCFVQVDAHASGHSRGQFFPTTTCTSATPSSPASSSTAPSSTAPSSTAVTSTAQTSTAPVSTSAAPTTTSQSLLPESTSRSTAAQGTFPVAQVEQSPSAGSLASTGRPAVLPVGVGALLLIAGAWLVQASRRPRRH